MVTFGSIVCNKLRQPQNYIEAVDSDSIEMKTAELLSGIDGTMMFRYNSRDTFKTLSIYLSEYQLGQRVSHKKVLELSYEDVKSSTNGLIVITPDFDNFTAKLIAAKMHKKRCSPVLPELHPMFDYFYTSSPIRSYSAEPVIFTFTKSPDISISPVLTKT